MKKIALFALVFVALCGLFYSAYAEDVNQPDAPKKLTPKEAIAQFSPYLAIREAGAAGIGLTAIAININGRDVQRPMNFNVGKSVSMALLIADDIVMYPSESPSQQVFFVNRGNDEGDGMPITITLPNGNKATGNELGLYKSRSVAFARVELPENHGMVKLELNDGPTPEVGDTIYLVGRRGSEWKCAPFFFPAVITGELNEDNRMLYSINLSQDQLRSELLGALAVTTTGKIIGLVNVVNNKTFSIIVAKPSDFSEAVLIATDMPDKLEKRNAGQIAPDWNRGDPPPPIPDEPPQPTAFLGVSVGLMTPEKAKELGFEEPTGVIIETVGVGNPAEAAGLQVGDVILEAGGLVVDSPAKLREIIAKYNPDDEIQLLVHRDGKEFQVNVKLGKPE